MVVYSVSLHVADFEMNLQKYIRDEQAGTQLHQAGSAPSLCFFPSHDYPIGELTFIQYIFI